MPTAPATPSSAELQFVRKAFIVIALAGLVATVWALADIVLLLFGAVLVAVLLRAIADPLARYVRLPEGLALTVAGLMILLVIAAGVLMLGPELSRQMRALFASLPGAFARFTDAFQVGSFVELLRGASSVSSIGNLASRIFSWSTTLLGVLASVVLVVSGGIYLAVDPQTYCAGLVKLFPIALHPNINATLDDTGAALRRWLGGQLAAMVLVGILAALGLWLVGVPSAFALGFIIGVAEFVPIIGPILAAIPAILIAGTQDWQTAMWTVGVLFIVQQIEANLIAPLITGRSVSVPPAVGLFAVVSLGVLFGPLGLLFGFPLAVVIDVAIRRLYVLDTLGERVEIMGEPARKSELERPLASARAGSRDG